MEQLFTQEQLLMAYRLIKIQITQDGKEIFEGSVPEDTKEKVQQLAEEKLGKCPDLVCEYENIREFILLVQGKTAEETKQIFDNLQEKDKMEYFICVAEDGYQDDIFNEEDIENFGKLGLTDIGDETTETLQNMLDIEFNLVINGAILPLLYTKEHMKDSIDVAKQEIKIQVVQDDKVIIEPNSPEAIEEKINEMLGATIGSYPKLDSECERIAEFVVSVKGKSALEIKEAYSKLVAEEAKIKDPTNGYYLKTGYYIYVMEDTYNVEEGVYSEKDIELYDKVGLTNEWRQNTKALMKLLNIEFQLVLDDVILPLAI
ncbi:hypothetical protein ABEX78_22240 [Priestia megaterium]